MIIKGTSIKTQLYLTLKRLLHLPMAPHRASLSVFAVCVLCCCFEASGLAVDTNLDERLIALIAARPATPVSDLEKSAKRVPEGQRLVFLIVGLELAGDAVKRVARLAPLVVGREQAAVQPFLTISFAEALTRTGDLDQAETVLAWLPSPMAADLDQADRSSVLAEIAYRRQHLSIARRELQVADAMLRRVAPDPAYETWRGRLIRLRLDRLNAATEAAAVAEAAGPACQAWLQADRTGTTEAYLGLEQRFPKSLFADAGQIEIARIENRSGHVKEALDRLDEVSLIRGPLAAVALLLRCDIQLVAGHPAEARKDLETALSSLTTAVALPDEIGARTLTYINPSQPLHRLDEHGYIVWDQRPRGTILAPAAHAETAAYLRYQIVVRLAVLARCTGDAPTAVALAHTLLTIDATDRALDQRNKASGSSLLAYTCETGKFMLPLEAAEGISDHARMLLWLGAGFYQVEDWQQAREWALLAAERIPARQAVGQQTARSLVASSEQMLNNYDQALATVALVQLKPGQAPHRAWFVARLVERSIYSNRGQDDLFMASQDRVREQAKGTEYASDALQAQASYMVSIDPARARHLLLQHEREFPGQSAGAIQFLRDRIVDVEKQNQKEKEKEKSSP